MNIAYTAQTFVPIIHVREKIETSRRGSGTFADAHRARRQFREEIERRDPAVKARSLKHVSPGYLIAEETLFVTEGPFLDLRTRTYVPEYLDTERSAGYLGLDEVERNVGRKFA